jgi:hypothetical protein
LNLTQTFKTFRASHQDSQQNNPQSNQNTWKVPKSPQISSAFKSTKLISFNTLRNYSLIVRNRTQIAFTFTDTMQLDSFAATSQTENKLLSEEKLTLAGEKSIIPEISPYCNCCQLFGVNCGKYRWKFIDFHLESHLEFSSKFPQNFSANFYEFSRHFNTAFTSTLSFPPQVQQVSFSP